MYLRLKVVCSINYQNKYYKNSYKKNYIYKLFIRSQIKKHNYSTIFTENRKIMSTIEKLFINLIISQC